MPKHERLSHRHRSHHLVLASPRVFVRNGQQFANLTYDVVFTHGFPHHGVYLTVKCHAPFNEPLSSGTCRPFVLRAHKGLLSPR